MLERSARGLAVFTASWDALSKGLRPNAMGAPEARKSNAESDAAKAVSWMDRYDAGLRLLLASTGLGWVCRVARIRLQQTAERSGS